MSSEKGSSGAPVMESPYIDHIWNHCNWNFYMWVKSGNDWRACKIDSQEKQKNVRLFNDFADASSAWARW